VDVTQNGFTLLGHVNYVSKLLRIHVIEVMPLKLGFFLYFSCYVIHIRTKLS